MLEALFAAIAGKVPFFVMTQQPKSNINVTVSTQRMLEAAIIGAVLAAIGYVAIIPRLVERLESIKEEVSRNHEQTEQSLRELRNKHDSDLRELRSAVINRSAH